MVTASWNQWVQEQGGNKTATPKNMAVKELKSSLNEFDYYICYVGTEEPLGRRKRILEDARYWLSKAENNEQSVKDWKAVLEIHLSELYAYQKAIISISKSYFESQPILFQDLANDLAEIITDTEELVNSFNEIFADLFQLSNRIDLETVRQRAKHRTSYTVDMAKAEALDSLGEREEGIKLVERYV